MKKSEAKEAEKGAICTATFLVFIELIFIFNVGAILYDQVWR